MGDWYKYLVYLIGYIVSLVINIFFIKRIIKMMWDQFYNDDMLKSEKLKYESLPLNLLEFIKYERKVYG